MVTACPRLRPLEAFPTELDGEQVLCLRDPSGLAEQLAYLPPMAVMIVSLCDGVRTAAEVAREASRRAGATLAPALVDDLLAQLDQALLLDSPRFHAHKRQVIDRFHAAPRRAPAHAGGSYPAAPAALRRRLDQLLAAAAPEAEAAPAAPVAGLIAPHIDFPRGGAVYGRAYAALRATPRPDLVIVFGTDHNGAEHPFTLTRKSYDTPLGAVETDVELVDELARAGDDASLFADELHHRTEHSIEFQAVWLRHVYGDDAPPVLPILCGGLHRLVENGRAPASDARMGDFVATLRRLTAGRRVLVVAGADLAHVGPRFGDGPFGARELAAMERADRAALAAAAAGDGAGFFAAIAAERDRFRVCGLAPVYATLTYLDGAVGTGVLHDYAHCPADGGPDNKAASFVSIAALTLPARDRHAHHS